MIESETERGPRAVIQSEIQEATDLAKRYRTGVSVIRLNFWAAVVGTITFTLDMFIAPPGDLGFVGFLVAWTLFNGWLLRSLRGKVDDLDAILEERRSALIAAGDA